MAAKCLNCLYFGKVYFLHLMEAVFEEYAAFENKVKRSVYIDNLSPLAKDLLSKLHLISSEM
ncbi:hypothetical protein H5410_021328 [Solanum commersonii]|uniref:Uncharacterized protein n=1 Tax=Solanum commersonii TaxID=4109 RepID=A0A9J5ZDN6_SOLCO|nr:hypothetical protein H5410_021328 [Solanum commersonii]